MKKFLLTISTLALFVCLFALSVSAANQSYSTFDVTLTDGTQKTAYTATIDPWEGRVYLNSKLYAEAPFDNEGTYEEIDWKTVKEIDFSNVMFYWYTNGAYREMEYGTNQGNTALCIYPSGIKQATQLTSLEKVTTGKAVVLRESAFNSAPALKTLVISKNLKEMQNQVFYNCTALESVIFEEGSVLVSLNDTFHGCKSLKSISFPATLNRIGGKAFYGCSSLESVTFDEGIQSLTIGEQAFYGCESLEAITLPQCLTSIGNSAFESCSQLVEIDIPDSVTYLGTYAFKKCSELTRIGITDNSLISNRIIGIAVSCSKLTSVRIPPLVTDIGYDNFWHCKALKEVIWPNNLTTISSGNNFSECTSLTSISIPNTVVSIASNNFSGCTALEEVNLGAGITHIPNGLLNLKAIKRVYISGKVVTIGQNVFGYSNPADSSSNITFIFTGTKAQAEALRSYLQTNGNATHAPNNSKFYGANLVSAHEYDVSQEPSGFTFVYDYDFCDAFYGGKHAMTGNATIKLDSYFSEIVFADTCTREGCGNTVIDDSKTIEAVFVDYGYSYTEVAINGSFSMSQFFGVNQNALAAYKEATGNTVEYGLVVSVSDNPLAEENSELITKGQTYITSQDIFKHDYFAINVSGIKDGTEEGTKDTREKALTFCAYVIDNGKVYYLDDGKTLEVATQKSYSDILGK